MGAAEVAFDFVEKSEVLGDVDSVLSALGAAASQFGFDHLVLTGLPVAGGKVEKLVLLNGWPEEWFERYAARDYFAIDGVSQWALRSCNPFLWNEVPGPLSDTEGSRIVASEARSFGIRDGFVVPMYSPLHWQSAISFASGNPCELSPRDRGALILMAIYADGLARKILGEPARHGSLTEREREILRWTAAGKSAWDVSVLLSISENTVIRHLQNVRHKYNVATTIQAVAESMRRGELHL